MGAIRDAVAIRRINTMRRRAVEALARLAGPGDDQTDRACNCAFCQLRRTGQAVAEAEREAASSAPPTSKAH